MCLIAYSKDGKDIPRHALAFAVSVNPHGIGVMSERGVEKFYGRKFYKRARRYLRDISGTPHAVHLRWTTHGSSCLELCHPFNIPQTDVYVMHNGVIRAAEQCMTANDSDTSAFVREMMTAPPVYGTPKYMVYLEEVEKFIGWGSKLVLFHADLGKFGIVNESAGHWKDDIWYSNYYSLPWQERTKAFNWDEGGAWQFGRGRLGSVGRAYGSWPTTPMRVYDAATKTWTDATTPAIVPASDTVTGSKAVALLPANSGTVVCDPTSRRVDAYYAEVARSAGYHDDGAELGAIAALHRRSWADDWPQNAGTGGAMVVHSED